MDWGTEVGAQFGGIAIVWDRHAGGLDQAGSEEVLRRSQTLGLF